MLLQNPFSWKTGHISDSLTSWLLIGHWCSNLAFISGFTYIYYWFNSGSSLGLYVCPWNLPVEAKSNLPALFFILFYVCLQISRLSAWWQVSFLRRHLSGSICFYLCMICLCLNVCDHSVCTCGGKYHLFVLASCLVGQDLLCLAIVYTKQDARMLPKSALPPGSPQEHCDCRLTLTCMAFMEALGVWIQAPPLTQQAPFPLSHLSSPWLLFPNFSPLRLPVEGLLVFLRYLQSPHACVGRNSWV